MTIFSDGNFVKQFMQKRIQIHAFQNIHNVDKKFLQRIFKKHFGLLICGNGNLIKRYKGYFGEARELVKLKGRGTMPPSDNRKCWYNNSHSFSPANGSSGFSGYHTIIYLFYFFPNKMLDYILFKVVILFFLNLFVRKYLDLCNPCFTLYAFGLKYEK